MISAAPKRVKIGKNWNGWYVSLPRWWGGYDVIENLNSFEAAWAVYDQQRKSWARSRLV